MTEPTPPQRSRNSRPRTVVSPMKRFVYYGVGFEGSVPIHGYAPEPATAIPHAVTLKTALFAEIKTFSDGETSVTLSLNPIDTRDFPDGSELILGVAVGIEGADDPGTIHRRTLRAGTIKPNKHGQFSIENARVSLKPHESIVAVRGGADVALDGKVPLFPLAGDRITLNLQPKPHR